MKGGTHNLGAVFIWMVLLQETLQLELMYIVHYIFSMFLMVD